jgi:sarcosine oxidase
MLRLFAMDRRQHFDIVICGLGVIGSAALHALATRGVRVAGIERFAPGHARGSSHGATRLIRLAYWEHPSYVPLVRRAYELWRALEAAVGRPLLHVTGIAEIGPPDGVLVRGTLVSARLHALRHEVLAAPEAMRRFPAFRLPDDVVAVLQPDGGFLAAEPSLQAFIALAQAAGAELRTGETVRAIEPRAGGVRVVTDRAAIDTGAAIVTAGAWTTSLLPELSAPLRATRQVMAWFEPSEPKLFAAERFPAFLIESRHGVHYGVPPFGDAGVKVAKHHHRDETVDPDHHDRTVSAVDEALVRAALAEFLPSANGKLLDARTCLYTMTPDGDFLIDRVPGLSHVVVASACSGHGFKFAPAIGEILAELATTGTTRHDIARFALKRFG